MVLISDQVVYRQAPTKTTYCNLCLVELAGRAVEGLTLRNSLESSFDFLSSFEAEITGLTKASLASTGMDGDDLQFLNKVKFY